MSMGTFNQKRDLDLVSHAIHAVFVYAACTEDGYVKVGISRVPFERIYSIHCGSPSPVRAAQWTWVGSLHMGKRIEEEVKKAWANRNTRGEWYRFDYSSKADKADFHDTLSAIVEVVTGREPKWDRLRPGAEMQELIRAGSLAMNKKIKAGPK